MSGTLPQCAGQGEGYLALIWPYTMSRGGHGGYRGQRSLWQRLCFSPLPAGSPLRGVDQAITSSVVPGEHMGVRSGSPPDGYRGLAPISASFISASTGWLLATPRCADAIYPCVTC